MAASSRAKPVELPSQPSAARRALARLLAEAEWPGDADGALLAVHEAMVNAHRHGGGVARATAGFEGPTLVVEVGDRGHGFDMPERPLLAGAGAERGRGLFLIRHLTSAAEVVAARGGARLVLRFGS
jgi:anti-sigma regulatory factor (Ser/Thr protein kinase)